MLRDMSGVRHAPIGDEELPPESLYGNKCQHNSKLLLIQIGRCCVSAPRRPERTARMEFSQDCWLCRPEHSST